MSGWIEDTFLGGAEKKAGKRQAKAEREAGELGLAASKEAIAYMERMFGTNVGLMSPQITAGDTARNAYMASLGLPTTGAATGGAPTAGTPTADPYGFMNTPEFNEQAYLAANPDVAEAISSGAAARSGEWTTPQEHYEMYGKYENRDVGVGNEGAFPTTRDPGWYDETGRTGAEAGAGAGAGAPAGDGAPVSDVYTPTNEFMGTRLGAPDYDPYAGPEARGPLGAGPGVPGRANLPGVVGAPKLGGPAQLPGMFQGYSAPDVYGRQALPDVLGDPNISTDVGITAPEFMTPDTSYEAFQASAPYRNMTFQQQEMLRAQAAGRSAQGNLYSGAAGRELERYGANIAQQGYGEFFGQATGAAQDININRQAAYANAMGLSREGYGRETDEFNRLRELYGDEVARSLTEYGMTQDIYGAKRGRAQDIYQSGQDIYGAQTDQAQYLYETNQERMLAQDKLNRRAWSDLTEQEKMYYDMDQTAYEQAITERGTQFDAAGILYGEEYGAATDVYNRGVTDFANRTAIDEANYARGGAEYTDYMGRLEKLYGAGNTATTNLAGFGSNLGVNVANTMMTGAGAEAGGITGYAEALGTGAVGAANATKGTVFDIANAAITWRDYAPPKKKAVA